MLVLAAATQVLQGPDCKPQDLPARAHHDTQAQPSTLCVCVSPCNAQCIKTLLRSVCVYYTTDARPCGARWRRSA